VDNLCQDVAHLAQEFRARPHGRHGAELQRVLNRMRSEPFAGGYVLVQEHRGQPYRLAQLGATPCDPISYTGDTFTTLAEAEWVVFKLRWRRLFGTDLVID
jgi:N,N-dimethylformamidase